MTFSEDSASRLARSPQRGVRASHSAPSQRGRCLAPPLQWRSPADSSENVGYASPVQRSMTRRSAASLRATLSASGNVITPRMSDNHLTSPSSSVRSGGLLRSSGRSAPQCRISCTCRCRFCTLMVIRSAASGPSCGRSTATGQQGLQAMWSATVSGSAMDGEWLACRRTERVQRCAICACSMASSVRSAGLHLRRRHTEFRQA